MGDSAPATHLDTQLFRDAFNASPIGIVVENLDGQPLFVNPAFCRFLGFTEEELQNKHCVDFSPAEDAAKDWALFQKLRTGSIDQYQMEKRYFRRDGSLVWGSLSLSLLNHRPSPLVLAMVQDITEKKTAEEARFRLAAIVESSEDAIISGTSDGIIVSWNAGAQQLYGYTEAEVVGKPITILVPLELKDEENEIRESLRAGGRIKQLETVRVSKTGKKINISLSISPVKDSSGRTVGISGIARDITERKRAEESRLRLAAIVESSEDAIISKTLDGVVVSWNKGAQKIYGYTESEAVGKPITMLVPPELVEEENEILEKLRAGNRIEHYETFRVSKAGKKINVSLTISPIKDSTGKTVGIAGISRDITERKRAGEALLSSEQRYRLLFERNLAGVAIASPEGRLLDCNDGWAHILGYESRIELQGRHASEFYFNPAERKPLVDELFEKHVLFSRELHLRRKDGTPVCVLFNAAVHSDHDTPIVQCTMIDISDWKRAQEALRASEERLRLAQQAARIGTFERDVRTGRITWTEGLESLYGLAPGSLEGKTIEFFKGLIHPDDFERAVHLIEKVLKTGEPGECEWRAIWSDGSVHWIESRWRASKDESGEPLRVFGVNMDVTERKQAERALHAQEELLKIFVKDVPAAVAMLDSNMRYLQVSDRWCTDYLAGRTEILGRPHYELFPDMPERWKEVHRRALAGETLRADEDHWVGQDGPHWAQWEVLPWKTPDGAVGGILILAEDITRRKQMEEAITGMTRKLIEAQEQERARIGRELHDDVNQRLAMLSVEVEQLRENPSEIELRVGELRKRIREISNDVQALSHDLHSSKLEYLGVVAGMKSWCKEFAEHRKLNVDFRSDVSSVLPLAVGLSLFRVLQEALNNASKHSGVKRIEVQLREDSGEIHLIVRDSGKGFDVDAALQGKGLGLTSMRERVRLVNGTIEIDSKPSGGTNIRVRVPLDSRRDAPRADG